VAGPAGAVAGGSDPVSATLAAASLLLAGGAGVMASLLVAPVRGARRVLALLALSGVSLAVGLALLDGLPAFAALLPAE
jgi:uncharacterized membrane protein